VHIGASVGRADARRGDAGDSGPLSRSGNAAGARRRRAPSGLQKSAHVYFDADPEQPRMIGVFDRLLCHKLRVLSVNEEGEKGIMLTRTIGSLIVAGVVVLAVVVSGFFSFSQVSNPAVASQPETAQDQKPEKKEPRSRYDLVKEWRLAAAQHSPGKPDSAAKKIGSWPEPDIAFVFDFLFKLTSQPSNSVKRTLAKAQIRRLLDLNEQEAKQGDLSFIIKQGVLLHTDIALLDLDTGEHTHSGAGMGFFADGGVINVRPETRHWEFARQLIDSLPSDDQIARRWYIATTAYMESRRFLGYAAQNLKIALEKFPSDNWILFYAGALHENLATPVHQNKLLPPGIKITYGSRESELKLARHFFQRSIAANPDFAEAQLHLGRVLALLGFHEQSVGELQKAASSLKDPQLLYYASLFLGCEFEFLSRNDEAREQYEYAEKLYPVAQSPLLALSRLSGRSDDAKGALDAVQRVFGLRMDDLRNEDPWWAYDLAHVRNADVLIMEMHKIFGEFRR
jgi:tetratricopeptide (TPR) repeat protein